MQTMSELNEMGCEEFADVAAELALGVLTGRERAQALMHLDQCEACRENVRQLTMTGEELLGLLPSSEPPPGFETRVMERIGLATASPGPRPVSQISQARHFGWNRTVIRSRRMLAAAAVVLTIAVSGIGGWGLHAATSHPSTSALRSATLLSATHQSVGQVFVYNGSSWWMYMSVATNSGNINVTCELEGTDGRITTVGSFKLVDGYGYWGSPVPSNVGQVTGARLVSTDGTVVASASIAGA
jgi:anti-sigma-K factor RskA